MKRKSPDSAQPKFKKLGSSDIEVCEVCLGTMTMGSMTDDEEKCFAIMDRYVELGGNFLDVAEMYPVPVKEKWLGRSEEIIGKWLAKRTDRSKLVIATKIAGPRAGAQFIAAPARERTLGADPAAAPPEADFSREQILRACEASLKRLQTDYIDVYQLHWPERYVPKWGESQYLEEQAKKELVLQGFDAVAAAMGELLKAGKIKSWGLSNETSFGVCAFAEACKRLGVPPPVSIQNDFSLCFRTFEGELAEACSPANHNLGLLAYGVLNGGALSGKYLPGAATPATADARFNFVKKAEVSAPGFQGRYKAERSNAAIVEYVQLAEELGTDAATLAQAWAYSRHYMAAVIIGATSIEQLEANWKAATFPLSEETCRKIDAIHCRHRNPNLFD